MIKYLNPITRIDYSDLESNSYLKDVEKKHHALFDQNNRKEDLPIIIDYGSSTFKAGWANSSSPDVVVRSIINRTKDIKCNQVVIGTMGKDVDIFKGNYQTPYERNLIYHQGAFESLNDHLFSELRCGQDGELKHPLIITEPCANAEQTRATTLDLLFECYGAPSVMLGIDALWGVFSDLNTYLTQTKLVISFGDQTTHIIPIIDGQVCYTNIKRINVGGQHSTQILYKNLQNRHQHLKQYIPFTAIEKIHRGYTQTAIDYSNQLKYFRLGQDMNQSFGYKDMISEQNKQYDDETFKGLIEPLVIGYESLKQQTQVMLDEDEVNRKQEIRYKQADRLKEALAKKKQEKSQGMLVQLQEYEGLLERFKLDPSKTKVEIEAIAGTKGIEEIKKRIKILKVKLEYLPKDALDEDKFQFIEVPDSQLTPEQLNQKRYQIIMKQTQQTKAIKKEEDTKKKVRDDAKRFKEEQPGEYLANLYEHRSNLNRKIEDRKKKQQEMNTRNSRFNQRRMQALAYLGADQLGKDDNFGVKDEDWDIYRGITRELDSDDENAEFKIQEVELELRELDPDFDDKVVQSKANIHQLGMDLFEITLTADRVKCNEIYFQPNLVGVDQCGLIDAIMLSIRGFSQQAQQKLLGDVLLIGGGALTKGLSERIKVDLQKEVDPKIEVQVNVSPSPLFDTWNGMKNFYKKNTSMVKRFSITREEYQEHGAFSQELLKIHPFSNIIE